MELLNKNQLTNIMPNNSDGEANYYLSYFCNLRYVLFDIRVGNSNLAKSLGEKKNYAMYQDENRQGCLLFLQN